MTAQIDYLIVGAGIIGMTIAHDLINRNKQLTIVIIEKESQVAVHASGRNSGVLHAGFYYTADSLKAKLTAEGNKKMKAFCHDNAIFVNETQKYVVANNQQELDWLYELDKRAKVNGVITKLVNADEIDPNIKTYQKALYSPSTASVNPKEVCYALRDKLIASGVRFIFNQPFETVNFDYHYLINCAGSYADKIAKAHGVGQHYTMLPFKGLYLKYFGDDKPISTNVYPVPNMKNPFLGVHYTMTANNEIKIGPTAIPVFWRENYQGLEGFKLTEFLEIFYYSTKLFILNKFNFRELAINEIKNYRKKNLIEKAQQMLHHIGDDFRPLPAGIRAQLLDTQQNELVMDFIVEHTDHSTHILNAVSPAFTCSFAFAEHVVDQLLNNESP
ncbi:MAG: FAD-dependent oxidoreductase [Methylococcales bacterium]|nr:FAD-dependent oxidoreductase [Methylococcales bacterium]